MLGDLGGGRRVEEAEPEQEHFLCWGGLLSSLGSPTPTLPGGQAGCLLLAVGSEEKILPGIIP